MWKNRRINYEEGGHSFSTKGQYMNLSLSGGRGRGVKWWCSRKIHFESDHRRYFLLCLNVFSDGRKVSNYFQQINIQQERSWYIKISLCANLPHTSNYSRSARLSSTSLMTLFSKDFLFRRRSCRNEGKLHVALWQGRSPWNTQALWSPFWSTGHIRPSSISDFYLPSNPSHFFT